MTSSSPLYEATARTPVIAMPSTSSHCVSTVSRLLVSGCADMVVELQAPLLQKGPCDGFRSDARQDKRVYPVQELRAEDEGESA